MNIRNAKDFYTGVIFMLFGVSTMVLAPGYRLGTAAKMGPGYFPFTLGGVLTALGLLVFLRSLSWRRGGKEAASFRLKPAFFVLSSIVLFGLLLRPLGLLPSTILLVLGSSMASDEFRGREALLNAFVLVVLVLIIFIYFLQLQVPVWPSFLVRRV